MLRVDNRLAGGNLAQGAQELGRVAALDDNALRAGLEYCLVQPGLGRRRDDKDGRRPALATERANEIGRALVWQPVVDE